MRNKLYFLIVLSAVIWILPAGDLGAQERDKVLDSYLIKLNDPDSAVFYHQKIIEYTKDIPTLANYLLKSSIKISQNLSDPYTDPAQRSFIQHIYDALHAGVPLDLNSKLNGYRILGDYYHVNYDIDQGLGYYNHALSIADTSRIVVNQEYLSVLYTNLSDAYLDLREFSKARLLIEKTIELDTKNMGPTSEFLGLDYINLATTYRRSDPKKSIIYYLKAKDQLKSITQKKQVIDEVYAFEYLYVLLADNYLVLDNPKQALIEIDTALAITKNNKGKISLIHGKALEAKAVILQHTKAYGEALRFHRMADRFFENKKEPITYRPKILLQMARCYLDMQQPENALKQIEQAFYLIDQSGDLGQSRFDKALFPEELFHLYYEQAKILTALHLANPEITFLHDAQKAYKEAMVIFEKMKYTVSDQQSRQIYMKSNATFFESAIDLNFQLWKEYADSSGLQQILSLSEKSKNNFLYESLNKTNTSLTEALPDSILSQIKSLDLKVSQTEKKLFQAQSKNNRNNVSIARDELIQYRRDQKFQMEIIEKNYPHFYQLKYQISVPTVKALQGILHPEQGVISYYIGVQHIYVLLIDQWDFSVERIPLTFSLLEKMDLFNNSIITSIRDDSVGKAALQTYHQTGFFLYQQLIAPFIRKLPKQLTILPDNLLENLSFEALLTELPEHQIAFKDYPYLLKKYTISYQYSANAIIQQPTPSLQADHHLLAFAPSFSEDKSFSVSQLRDFGKLSHNVEEVDKIKKIIGSGLVLKTDKATEENFMKLAPAYQIIHLATHGKVNAQHSDYSYLAFQEIKDSIENELLYIKDIYGLQLKADLVVLSACETANGSLAKGEGIVNLARGFTHAGAASVVPTLWKISDVTTARLMEKFYLELKAGQPKHIAMAKTKRHFLETTSASLGHPFYWAAFVLIGDVSPILLPQDTDRIFDNNFLLCGTGVFFVIVLLCLWSYRYKTS